MKLLIINGPNLNTLGKREPEVYGNQTIDSINEFIREHANSKDIDVDFYQSNTEGEIINKLQQAEGDYDGIVMNPAAYTHYSIALADAVASISVPVVEVHLSNIYAREEYRQHSVIAAKCVGQIAGFGRDSYILAVDALYSLLSK